MTTAVLDPAQAIAAAVTEVYDQLRELLDRGRTDDPGLLDEVGALLRRARGRVTRARKRTEAETAERPTTPTATTPSAAPTPQPATPASPAVAIPAATSPASDRVTVRLTEPAAVPSTVRPRPAPAAQSGRHRRPSRLSRIWAAVTVGADVVNTVILMVLLAVALTAAGYGIFVALEQTDIPWVAVPFAALYAAAGGTLLYLAYRMRAKGWSR